MSTKYVVDLEERLVKERMTATMALHQLEMWSEVAWLSENMEVPIRTKEKLLFRTIESVSDGSARLDRFVKNMNSKYRNSSKRFVQDTTVVALEQSRLKFAENRPVQERAGK